MSKKLNDSQTNIQELKDMVAKFCIERNWRKYHTPKNLAISISLEASELLEHFQWDDLTRQDKQEISDELSDILFNMLNFATIMDIDIAKSFDAKFKKIEKKFPVEIFNKDRDIKEDFNRIKKEYREKSKGQQ